MQNYDCFSNLCIDYYYGTFTNCSRSWCGYDQILPYSKLYFIIDGECEVKTDSGTVRGKPGRIIYVPPRTKHSFYHINENFVKKYWLHFGIETMSEDLKDFLSLPPYADVPKDMMKSTSELFENIYAEGKKNTVVSNLRIKAYILELFSLYAELTGALEPEARQKEPTERVHALNNVMQYINANLDKKLSVDELSGMMHIHPNYFIRMFKKSIGVSPLKYINKMRFEKALSLFANDGMNISDIMTSVGFDDYSTFSTFFKSYSGYSPKNYRRIFLKDNGLEQNNK